MCESNGNLYRSEKIGYYRIISICPKKAIFIDLL